MLDEGVPRRLVDHLPGHHVVTVPEAGWSGVKNGVLLASIQDAGFDVFISCDQNLVFQQAGLDRRPFAVLVLSTNHFPTLQPHLARIAEQVAAAKPGVVALVECGRFVPRRFQHGSP